MRVIGVLSVLLAGVTVFAGTLPVVEQAPNFTLTSHRNTQVSLADFRDEVVLLSFVYTSCPGVCPLVTSRLREVDKALAQEPALARRVKIVSVTIDPENDTPAVLRAYARLFQVDNSRWVFLTGEAQRIKKVLDEYDLWSERRTDGLIDHVMRVYLLDPDLQVREIYNTQFMQVPLVVADVSALLEESAARRPQD